MNDAFSTTLNDMAFHNSSAAKRHKPSRNLSDNISHTIHDGIFAVISQVFADIITDCKADNIEHNILLMLAQLLIADLDRPAGGPLLIRWWRKVKAE
jgi:hypothetical protein